MKALIFNSGIGHRMGDITKSHPKCMTPLLNHETIFGRQIRILSECGITEFVVTTGPFPEQLYSVAKPFEEKGCHFEWVQNPIFDKSNYIQSCYYARDYLYNQDLITLHGDLVFNKKLVEMVLKNNNSSLCLINKKLPKPEKDFKGRVVNGKLKEVGINIFDDNCFTFQPFYKLSKSDTNIWLNSISDFIENKKINNVYAENALNVISDKMNIIAVSYDGYFINEIDDPNDYLNVTNEIEKIDYRDQLILSSKGKSNTLLLSNLLSSWKISHPLFVVDSFLINPDNNTIVPSLIEKFNGVAFTNFTPNPKIEEVEAGIKAYKQNKCDGIISIGGGSAIDVSKAIKLFLPLKNNLDINLKEAHVYSDIKLIAIPTTAGTGSESTRYAVIYKNGEKQSLTDDLLVPDAAILDTIWLKTLPINQKKATVFDALCHSIESIWSINANKESQKYAYKALTIILANIDDYLNSKECSFRKIQLAANLAGKAINLTQTTAAHAMSYKITSEFHIPHGQAVALCLPLVWDELLKDNFHHVIKSRKQLENSLLLLNKGFKSNSNRKSLIKYETLLKQYSMIVPLHGDEDKIKSLSSSINIDRLKNFPISFSYSQIFLMYKKLFN